MNHLSVDVKELPDFSRAPRQKHLFHALMEHGTLKSTEAQALEGIDSKTCRDLVSDRRAVVGQDEHSMPIANETWGNDGVLRYELSPVGELVQVIYMKRGLESMGFDHDLSELEHLVP